MSYVLYKSVKVLENDYCFSLHATKLFVNSILFVYTASQVFSWRVI